MNVKHDLEQPVISIETSGRLGSAAVAVGGAVVACKQFAASLNHGVELLPAISRLCEQAGVTPDRVANVYVSGGPGSFTGLRVGITFAKSMALAHGARMIRVPTLDVIAQNALDANGPPDRVAVVLDAKRRRVYANWFERAGDQFVAREDPAERDPKTFLESLAPIAVLGEGVSYHRDAIESVSGVTLLSDPHNQPRAEIVFKLGQAMASHGEFTDIDAMIPIYVRLPEAEEKWQQKHNDSGGDAERANR